MSVHDARACGGQTPVLDGPREAETSRKPSAATARTAAAYAAAGAVVAAVWALGGDVPAGEHALRVLVVVLCISVAGRLLGRRLARAGRAPLDRRLFLGLVAAKVLLVGVALVVDRLAGLWFADPSVVTAVFLFAVVAAGGPLLHGRLSHPTAPVRAGS
ncbi:hypothetical protein [Streptomyces sp. NRRL F-2664]|uniref:hypothetical protein n=1 Tax=Streptomyces sp. NRRL F-2664 TaxID=1463842 RepID=UPI0004C6F314|nr:hypothetical protein [Streptomyces sp. NRRL F-2664]